MYWEEMTYTKNIQYNVLLMCAKNMMMAAPSVCESVIIAQARSKLTFFYLQKVTEL